MPDEPIEQEEKYEPTASDLALFASLVATEVGQNIMQLHADGELTTKGYTVLYEVSRRAMAAIETLHQRLEAEEKDQTIR